MQPLITLTTLFNFYKTNFAIKPQFYTFALSKTVDVAQLVRASVCGTEGRGFEPHHLPLSLSGNWKAFFMPYFLPIAGDPKNMRHRQKITKIIFKCLIVKWLQF